MNHDTAEKIRYFDGLAPRWDETVGNDQARRDRIDEVFTMIDIGSGASVLDIGCGNGVLFRTILGRIGPGGSLVALDPSPMMIARAKELHPDIKNIEYVTGLVEDAGFPDGSFDTILCFAVLPHLASIPKGLEAMRRALKPAGLLYIFHLDDTATLNRFHSGMNAPVKHDMLPEEDELKKVLAESGFSVDTYIDRPGLNFVRCAPC